MNILVKNLKSFLGYLWALLAFFIVLVTFLGNNYFSHKLASATAVAVSPWYSGGEILHTIDHGAYKTYLHRPVFDGLMGEREDGFIQVNWEPLAGLPSVIEEYVTYSGNRNADFFITLDTKTGSSSLKAFNPTIVSIKSTYKLKNGWAVRIALKK